MDRQQKQWQKPELIVLVRSRPEEAVLDSCKMGLARSEGYNNGKGSCWKYDTCGFDCWAVVGS